MAVMAGLSVCLGACSITIGGGGGSRSADRDATTQTQQPSSGENGQMSVNGVVVGDAPNSSSTGTATGDSSGSSSSGSRNSSSSSASWAEKDMVGRWECVSVWNNGNKRTAAEAGVTSDYYEFRNDGTVTSSTKGQTEVGDYRISGTKGSIVYPQKDDNYNETIEVSQASDGTGPVVKIAWKGSPENFRVYKKVSGSSSATGTSSGGAASGGSQSSVGSQSASGSVGSSSSGTGTSGSSSGSSSGSDTPVPGTVVDGWKWV